jgi:hypothetical protein
MCLTTAIAMRSGYRKEKTRTWHDADFGRLMIAPPLGDDLIEKWNAQPVAEVAKMRRDRVVAELRLDGKPRFFFERHDEIDFALVDVPQITKSNIETFDILKPMTELEQMRSHHVLEPRSWIFDERSRLRPMGAALVPRRKWTFRT